MKRAGYVGTVVWALALSGCLTPAKVTTSHDVSACNQMLLYVGIDMERAATLLPVGYTPAPAESFRSEPRWDGMALGSLDYIHCSRSELEGGPFSGSSVSILVEPPTLHAVGDIPPADHSFYTLRYWTNGTTQLERLGLIGYDIEPGEVRITQEKDGQHAAHAFSGNASLHSSQGVVLEEQDRGPALWRFWHEADQGTTHLDLDVSAADVQTGSATRCRAENEAVSSVFGGVECDRLRAIVASVAGLAWKGTFVHHPE